MIRRMVEKSSTTRKFKFCCTRFTPIRRDRKRLDLSAYIPGILSKVAAPGGSVPARATRFTYCVPGGARRRPDRHAGRQSVAVADDRAAVDDQVLSGDEGAGARAQHDGDPG